MIIGFLSLDIHLPYSHSLKEKRQRLSGFKDRIKNKFNVAIAELDYQDKWQRSRLGFTTLNSSRSVVENMLNKIIREAEEHIEGEIIDHELIFF